MHGESTVIFTFSPEANAARGLCMFSENEAKSDVQAAHGKEEKCGDKREFVNVVRENRCPNESLEDPEGAEAKLRTEDREKAVEEGHWPRDLRENEKDELEDDEEAVEDGPEDSCGLIGNGTASYVATSSLVEIRVVLRVVHCSNI